jgi:hypothetical protein
MECTAPNTFAPNLPATRAVLVNALYRAAHYPGVNDKENPFKDIPNDADYTYAVYWAAAEGIVQGRGDGNFDPEGNITRQDLAVIFLRYLQYKGKEIPPLPQEQTVFADDEQIAAYAKDAVQTLHRLGIIQGVGGNAINPRGTATRAQVAAMLQRFLELE